MKLQKLKEILNEIHSVRFQLPNGNIIPVHFHVTEVGLIKKNFIDCGGKVRQEEVINFQLWEADDFDHRLAPQKLNSIIEVAEKTLHLPDAEIEVEYQSETIGKYGLEFNGISFLLTNKLTACLAEDACGIPSQKTRVNLSELKEKAGGCDPKSGWVNASYVESNMFRSTILQPMSWEQQTDGCFWGIYSVGGLLGLENFNPQSTDSEFKVKINGDFQTMKVIDTNPNYFKWENGALKIEFFGATTDRGIESSESKGMLRVEYNGKVEYIYAALGGGC